VRILQKSKENGQNRTITDTGMEEHTKIQENAIKTPTPPPSLSSPSPRHYHHTTITAPHLTTTAPCGAFRFDDITQKCASVLVEALSKDGWAVCCGPGQPRHRVRRVVLSAERVAATTMGCGWVAATTVELRVERERQEEASKVAIADMFNEVQERIDVDYELPARMTYEEQEKYTIKERARLLAEFFERRKKQLSAERA
ncbi:hypothetical protein Tco_0850934, partial [Tanacetum coccineum]